jgi:glutathionyl-hydroquinone reductase
MMIFFSLFKLNFLELHHLDHVNFFLQRLHWNTNSYQQQTSFKGEKTIHANNALKMNPSILNLPGMKSRHQLCNCQNHTEE